MYEEASSTVTVAVTVDTTGTGGEVHEVVVAVAEVVAAELVVVEVFEAIAAAKNASNVFPVVGGFTANTIPALQ